MTKTFTATILVLFFAFSAAAQVEISPMKVIYIRPQKNLPDFKQRFEIRYPTVEGVKNAALRRRIEAAISYWKVFDTTLNEDLNEYTWLDSMDYNVAYNNDGVLDIELIRQGTAAYADGWSQHVVVNTKTGRQITKATAFKNIAGLNAKILEAQRKEIADQIEKLRRDDKQTADSFESIVETEVYGGDKFEEFSVSDSGVTFIYDYGFPHSLVDLEPSGEYFFSWQEMQPFLKARGPLGRFRMSD